MVHIWVNHTRGPRNDFSGLDEATNSTIAITTENIGAAYTERLRQSLWRPNAKIQLCASTSKMTAPALYARVTASTRWLKRDGTESVVAIQ